MNHNCQSQPTNTINYINYRFNGVTTVSNKLDKKVKPFALLLQLQLKMLQDLQKKHKPTRRMNHKFLKAEKVQINFLTFDVLLPLPEEESTQFVHRATENLKHYNDMLQRYVNGASVLHLSKQLVKKT